MRFHLDWFPTSRRPILEGDYVIFNPCDGYHIVEGIEDENCGIIFQEFGGRYVKDDFYVAWAKLPTVELMWERFDKKTTEPAGG